MNFLELAQDLGIEAGVSGGGTVPVTVTGQIGEPARLVRWIAKAHEEVQNLRIDWNFLRVDFSFNTTIGVQAYTPAAVTPALPEHQNWKVDSFRCYLTATGTVDEQWMEYCPYELFRDKYLYSANRTVTGRPTIFTIRPQDMAILTFPLSNAVYTIAGEYYQRPFVMVADADEPLFPRQFHRIVVWRALQFYGAFEGAPEVYAHGGAEYGKLIIPLEGDQLPNGGGIEVAGPLA